MKVKKKFYWTQEDLCFLWTGLHAHVSYRDLAAELGRTYTSIHKAVRRYELEQKPTFHNPRLLWRDCVRARHSEYFSELCHYIMLSEGKNWNLKAPANLKGNRELQRNHYERPQNYYSKQWNYWSEIVSTLRNFGVSVQKIQKQRAFPGYDYLVNQKPMSRTQVVLITNRLRLEHNLPPLHLPELWD